MLTERNSLIKQNVAELEKLDHLLQTMGLLYLDQSQADTITNDSRQGISL